MNVLISESARNQKWFDNLDSSAKKAYLEKHPKSKFGKTHSTVPSGDKEHRTHVAGLTGNSAKKTKHGHSSVVDSSKLGAVKRRLGMQGYTKQDDGTYLHKSGKVAKFVKRGDVHKLHVTEPNRAKPKAKAKVVVSDKLASIKAELSKFKSAKTQSAKEQSFKRLKALRAKV